MLPEPAIAAPTQDMPTPAADAALRALVRALARQAAAEMFAGARAVQNKDPANAAKPKP